MAAAAWTRVGYFLHRWIGTILGAVVFVWFASGVVMMYYPWPAIPDSRELRSLAPFEPDSALVGFARAWSAAAGGRTGGEARSPLVGGRLRRLGDRMVYQFYRDAGGGLLADDVVDAVSGRNLSPISPEQAEAAARAVSRIGAAVRKIDLLPRGDHYLMSFEYAAEFPAYRVSFADPGRTAVYVSARGGHAFGVVNRRTRITTWLGTVPHWFYFMWLYDRPATWNAAIVGIGALVLLLALTGIVWGTAQLLSGRARYRGVSRWHHLSGIVCGVLVLTWTASGIWQNLGEGNAPRAGQAARIRGGATRWQSIRLSEAGALARLRRANLAAEAPVAIDLVQFDGSPGYEFRFAGGGADWIDAATGRRRADLDAAEGRRAAARALGDSLPINRIEHLVAYDEYYYARHGRELPLPVWRVTFADPSGSRLYLDPVSGAPTGFVDGRTKRDRWLRDAPHSLDFRVLNNHRPLWDAVMLPLLLGGLLASGSGVLLMLRRWGRLFRRAVSR